MSFLNARDASSLALFAISIPIACASGGEITSSADVLANGGAGEGGSAATSGTSGSGPVASGGTTPAAGGAHSAGIGGATSGAGGTVSGGAAGVAQGGDGGSQSAGQAGTGGEPGLSFDEPCTEDSDCESGRCIEGNDGAMVCTQPCSNDCPEGFRCASLAVGDGGGYCVPRFSRICRPCSNNSDCRLDNVPSESGRCLPYEDGSEGSFCARAGFGEASAPELLSFPEFQDCISIAKRPSIGRCSQPSLKE